MEKSIKFKKGDRIVSKEEYEYKGKKFYSYYRIEHIQPRCKVHWIHQIDERGKDVGAFTFMDIENVYKLFKKL